jgi:hypothetical protein
MQKKITGILIVGVCILLSTFSMDAQNYQRQQWVMGSGGVVGSQTETTSSKTMSGILGQLAIDKVTSTGDVHTGHQGFWFTWNSIDVPDDPHFTGKTVSNYPNPFNSSTTIQYQLEGTATVTIKIFDVMGNLVKVLENGEIKDQGNNTVLWNGKNEYGMDVSAGSYFYELNVQPAQIAGYSAFTGYSLRNVMIIVR